MPPAEPAVFTVCFQPNCMIGGTIMAPTWKTLSPTLLHLQTPTQQYDVSWPQWWEPPRGTLGGGGGRGLRGRRGTGSKPASGRQPARRLARALPRRPLLNLTAVREFSGAKAWGSAGPDFLHGYQNSPPPPFPSVCTERTGQCRLSEFFRQEWSQMSELGMPIFPTQPKLQNYFASQFQSDSSKQLFGRAIGDNL